MEAETLPLTQQGPPGHKTPWQNSSTSSIGHHSHLPGFSSSKVLSGRVWQPSGTRRKALVSWVANVKLFPRHSLTPPYHTCTNAPAHTATSLSPNTVPMVSFSPLPLALQPSPPRGWDGTSPQQMQSIPMHSHLLQSQTAAGPL